MQGHRVAWALAAFLVLSCASLPTASWTMPAPAEQADASNHAKRVFDFDIPAQTLQDALEQYGAVTGVSVVYLGTLVTGRRSQAVSGRLEAGEALRRLLAGSGLSARYTSQNALVLVGAPQSPRGASTPAASRPEAGRYRQYYGTVQGALRAALCRDPLLAKEDFRAALQFWVSAAGRLERIRLLDSTGLPARDDALLRSLERAVVGPPPPGFEQPFTMIMLPLSAGRTASCDDGR
ncbi:Outer membrane TonB-dependent transducer VreA of trans-envelope signaling system [plant metagenome]|uniref:Outer membrane TonB-dependent transducer VreA of trans-envelope signaling system n=1 Tax=plant metagenome TaxID=1297885 RepID=A0A484UWD5_9ZZZZ